MNYLIRNLTHIGQILQNMTQVGHICLYPPPPITDGLGHPWMNSAQILVNALQLMHALQVGSLIVMHIICLVFI